VPKNILGEKMGRMVSEAQNDRHRGVERAKGSGGPSVILLLREARGFVVEVRGCAVVIARKLCLFVDANQNQVVIEILRDGMLVAGKRVSVYSVNCYPHVFRGKGSLTDCSISTAVLIQLLGCFFFHATQMISFQDLDDKRNQLKYFE
jgi:hypothetical protein